MKAKRVREGMQKLNIVLLMAFLIPVFMMLAVFVSEGVYPFGNRSFVVSDMYHQYMPFFREFMEKIKAGEGLGYSFRVGLGSNFLALYVYYLASPLHWLAFLFGEAHLMEFLTYLVVCKIGLCGLSFAFYLQKHFDCKLKVVVLVSSFYALSGYMMAYNFNIMWLDCVILLPILVLGLERLVKEGKCGLYCIALGLSIFTNYYLSIMICIFLILYFLYLFLTERKGFRAIWQFILYSLLAGGMAALLLIPEALAILETDFGNAAFPEEVKFYFNILDELSRHCICVSTERGLDHWPNIYCGVAVFVLVPMFILNHKISLKRRFGMCVLLGVFLLGFSVNVLDFIWHGFNYPDSFPARQSFIYIFLVLVMCFEGLLRMGETKPRYIVYSVIVGMAFLLLCQTFVNSEHFQKGTVLLSMLFVLFYGIMIYCYRRFWEEEWRKTLFPLVLLMVVVELLVNSVSIFVGTTNREKYLSRVADYQVLYAQTKEKTAGNFYRVELFDRTTKNDAVLAGYPSASVFSSTQNSKVADFYERLGMRHSKVFYAYDGATPFSSALLNVKYLFGNEEDSWIDVGYGREYTSEINDMADITNVTDIGGFEGGTLYKKVSSINQVNLYECSYFLPMGYVAPYGYEMPEGFKQSPLRLQNAMINDLGVDGELFEPADGETFGEEVVFTATEDGYYYMVVSASGTKKIKATYAWINMESKTATSFSRLQSEGEEVNANTEKEFTDLKKGCVLTLGYLEAGSSVTLINADESDDTPKIKLDPYYMNIDILEEALEVLSKKQLENVSYTSNSLKGSIKMEEAGRLILSIPYEKGWTVFLNGEELEPSLFGEVFMAFDLEEGEYELEMNYVPYGRNLGILISAVSILVFAMCMWWKKKNSVRCKMDQI